ncbi:MAG: hypothetical protein Q7J57_16380 [Gemmobacter sp.]|nr:hypothetical protein [Gemmobacter sp.]
MPVQQGRVMYISADDGELHRRTADILHRIERSYDDLEGMTLRSLAGEDALLAAERQLSLIESELFKRLDARVLATKKSNCGSTGREIAMLWRAGVFVAEEAETGLDKLAPGAKAERVFLTLLRTFDNCPGSVIDLPVGSVALAAVHLIEMDGMTTPVTPGFWLEGGRYPRMHFTSTPGGRQRVTCTAGFGNDAESVLRDLGMAICDQVARLYDQRGGVF